MKTTTLLIVLLLTLSPLTLAQTSVRVAGDILAGESLPAMPIKPLIIDLKPGGTAYADVTNGQEIILTTRTQTMSFKVTDLT